MYSSKDFFKNTFPDAYNDQVFCLLKAMDEKIDTIQFGNYSELMKLVELQKSPIASIGEGSLLIIPNGVRCEIDVHEPMIKEPDYGQFLGKCVRLGSKFYLLIAH